jgi:predicted dehydrogenase
MPLNIAILGTDRIADQALAPALSMQSDVRL